MGVDSPWVYLDSCIVIYLVEEHTVFLEQIRTAISAAGDAQFCISALVELECLVVPLRLADTDLQAEYERFFSKLVLLPILDEAYRTAARLRATYGLKTPDALHTAIAQYHGCTHLWTNDDRLSKAARGLAVNVSNLGET